MHKSSTTSLHQNSHSATQNSPPTISWNCKKTEPERIRMNITNEVWKGGKKEIEKLINYVKKIQMYNGIKRKSK
jgi:hypothetical protein